MRIIILILLVVSVAALFLGGVDLLSQAGVEVVDTETQGFTNDQSQFMIWATHLMSWYRYEVHPMMLDALGLDPDASAPRFVVNLLLTLSGMSGLFGSLRTMFRRG